MRRHSWTSFIRAELAPLCKVGWIGVRRLCANFGHKWADGARPKADALRGTKFMNFAPRQLYPPKGGIRTHESFAALTPYQGATFGQSVTQPSSGGFPYLGTLHLPFKASGSASCRLRLKLASDNPIYHPLYIDRQNILLNFSLQISCDIASKYELRYIRITIVQHFIRKCMK